MDRVQEIPDSTRSATPRSPQRKDFHAACKHFRTMDDVDLDAARVGVFRAGVAAESFQGVIWNFTDILTRVLTPPLRSKLRDLSRSRASDLLLC